MAVTTLTLTPAVQGARNSTQLITWTGQDLTNSTLTGTKRNKQTGVVSALDGSLAIVTAASGIFRWTYGAGDVGEAGQFEVQFKATYTQFDATIESPWTVFALQEATAVAAAALLGVTAAQRAFLDTVNVTSPADGELLIYDDTAGEWANTASPYLPTAGGTMSGTLAMADNLITRPKFTDYGETVNAIGSIGGGTQDIDLTLGNVVSGTVDTSTTTFTFSNPPASGTAGSFTLILTNGGSQTVNWPAAVQWAGGTEPTLTASGVDVLTFVTLDGGTTWLGFAAGLDMQAPP